LTAAKPVAAARVRTKSITGAERETSLGNLNDISRITISFCGQKAAS
jgi:hypothetical protein